MNQTQELIKAVNELAREIKRGRQKAKRTTCAGGCGQLVLGGGVCRKCRRKRDVFYRRRGQAGRRAEREQGES